MVFTTLPFTIEHLKFNTLGWDIFGYYLYLPATFIYDDIAVEREDWLMQIQETYEPSSTFYQLHDQPNGKKVIQYTSGQAILYLPFFAIGHAVALVTDYPADGFSVPYETILNLGMLLYFALALWWLILLGRRYFSEQWIAVGLIALYFGTNLIQIAGQYILTPHIGLFVLYAALLKLSDDYTRNRKSFHPYLIGIVTGLIVLNRPTEIAAILIPLLWGYGSHSTPGWKVGRRNPTDFVIALTFGALAILPQLIYWKMTAGSWVHLSYENPAEGFDWFQPHTYSFLFSFQKGWLIYTPIGFFMLAGLVMMRNKLREGFIPSLIVIVAGVYLMSTWSTWHYAGGSYSSRTMVNIYPVLFLPLTLALKTVLQTKGKWIWGTLILLLIGLNLFQLWQWRERILDRNRMTFEYYKHIFLKTETKPEWEKYMLVHRESTTHQKFEHPDWYTTTEVHEGIFQSIPRDTVPESGELAVKLDENRSFTPAWSSPFSRLTKKDHVWLHIKVELWIPDTMSDMEPPLLVVHNEYDGKTYNYRTFAPETWNQRLDSWQTYEYHYLTPPIRQDSDKVITYLWHRESVPVFVRDFAVGILERKD